jgi:dimethylargininase
VSRQAAGREVAIVRELSRSLARCEITHIAREPIDFERALRQHEAYVAGLERNGIEVVRLPADERHPDGCFVEDAAVVLDELAVIGMPGAPSRRGETAAVEAALRAFRGRIERLSLPATLDGGDVLVHGRRVFVGRTTRTNEAGIDALQGALAPFGYEVISVAVSGCLHLKSAVSAIDGRTLLANRDWFDAIPFSGVELVDVDASEPGAANVLPVGDELWAHPGHPRTFERLARLGLPVVAMDVSEFLKAEAALTCKSLIFRRS